MFEHDDGCMADYYDPDYEFRGGGFGPAPERRIGGRHPLANPAEVLGFLGQGERWVAAAGPMDIADMEPGHALATANFLLARAQAIALTLSVAEPACDFRADVVSDVVARQTVMGTELFAALMRRASLGESRKPSWAK